MVDHTLKENCETCPACELRREGLDLTRIDREAVPCNACGGTGLIPIPPKKSSGAPPKPPAGTIGR